MNDEDFKRADEISIFLSTMFLDCEIDRHRESGRGLSCYYIKCDVKTQLILKITDECIMDKQTSEIQQVIESKCIPVMKQNENMVVVLFNDFRMEIEEP